MSTDPLAHAPRSDRSRVNQRLAPQPSQRQAQRTLHDARRACRRHRPESRVGLVARRVKPRRGIEAGILRVVEGVVSFPTELEVALFPLHVEPLGNRHVPVVDARIAEIVLSGIARVIHAWPGRSRRVEPLIKSMPSEVALPITLMRWPSPPPVMSVPSVVENPTETAVPVTNWAMPDTIQSSSTKRVTGFGKTVLPLGTE